MNFNQNNKLVNELKNLGDPSDFDLNEIMNNLIKLNMNSSYTNRITKNILDRVQLQMHNVKTIEEFGLLVSEISDQESTRYVDEFFKSKKGSRVNLRDFQQFQNVYEVNEKQIDSDLFESTNQLREKQKYPLSEWQEITYFENKELNNSDKDKIRLPSIEELEQHQLDAKNIKMKSLNEAAKLDPEILNESKNISNYRNISTIKDTNSNPNPNIEFSNNQNLKNEYISPNEVKYDSNDPVINTIILETDNLFENIIHEPSIKSILIKNRDVYISKKNRVRFEDTEQTFVKELVKEYNIKDNTDQDIIEPKKDIEKLILNVQEEDKGLISEIQSKKDKVYKELEEINKYDDEIKIMEQKLEQKRIEKSLVNEKLNAIQNSIVEKDKVFEQDDIEKNEYDLEEIEFEKDINNQQFENLKKELTLTTNIKQDDLGGITSSDDETRKKY